MVKVIYAMGASLDGYVEDPSGSIAFTAPDEDVHRLANEQAREASAFLCHLDLGGPGLAASLLDLVDEFRLWVNPVAVGGGKPFFPAGAGELQLRLAEHRALPSGAVYLRYERAR